MNQFGGSIGGPILKDKLFFFASQENLLQRVNASFNQDTLSPYARSLAAPAIQPVLAAFPVSTIPTTNPYFNLAYASISSYVNGYFGSARLDYKINDRNSAFVRYQRDQGASFVPGDASGSAR